MNVGGVPWTAQNKPELGDVFRNVIFILLIQLGLRSLVGCEQGEDNNSGDDMKQHVLLLRGPLGEPNSNIKHPLPPDDTTFGPK